MRILLIIFVLTFKTIDGKPPVTGEPSDSSKDLIIEEFEEAFDESGNEIEDAFILLRVPENNRTKRQDDDSGESNVVPLTPGVSAQNVGQILAGIFSGNITRLFLGSAGFIEETDVQQNIGVILQNVGNPLTMVSQTILGQVGSFLGFTTPKPPPKRNYTTSTTEFYPFEEEETTTLKGNSSTTEKAGATTAITTAATTESVKNETVTTSTTQTPTQSSTKKVREPDGGEDQDDSSEYAKSID